MAITKLSHVKERKSGNPNAGLYNCIDYILNPDKTEERYIGGNAGSTTQEVYNRMMATKQEFRKLDGRQCYHFIIIAILLISANSRCVEPPFAIVRTYCF